MTGYPDPDAIPAGLFLEMTGRYMGGHGGVYSADIVAAARRGLVAALRHAGCTTPPTDAMVAAAARHTEAGEALRAAFAAA